MPESATSYLSRDKKSVGNLVNAILISAIGQYEIVPLEDPSVLLDALAASYLLPAQS
jgi:hypothetical protein